MPYTPHQRKMIYLGRTLSRNDDPRVQRALLSAMAVESNFRNINYGDRDSQGVLQQRPSTGWGPPGNARQDILQFLERARKKNQGFKGTPGQLAQAVQVSAFPDRYDKRMGQVNEILRRPFGGGGSASGLTASSGGTPAPRPATPKRTDVRKGQALAFLDFATNYAETGEVTTNSAARLLGAVTTAGTVEPPVVRKKGQAQLPSRPGLKGGVADKVLAAAHTQVGKPYVFGSGPNTDSFDCSDLVQWAWGQVGVDIPRTTYEQIKVLPKKSWKNIQPGDLIYKNDGGHVVMYVGGGKVIAAPYTGTVVQYQPVSRFDKKNYHVRSVM